MDDHLKTQESLIERLEQYSKSNVELYRLKAIDKSADIISTLAVRMTVSIFFTLFFVIMNLGVALWIGTILEKSYYGFFIVSGFYALLGIILFPFRNKWIKTPIKNLIIIQGLN